MKNLILKTFQKKLIKLSLNKNTIASLNTLFLEENKVHVWVIKKDSIIKFLEYYRDLLSIDEKKKSKTFRFSKDRNTYILARGALRLLLTKYLKIHPKNIVFNYCAFGKPKIKYDYTIKFNVSHSGEMIVIAFCNDYDIGIDVEYIKRDFDVFDIVDNYFSKQEIKALHKIPNNQLTEAFFRGWTRKEAFIKAKSQGLSFPLDSFSISMDSDDNAELYETAWDKNEKNLWNIVPFETHKDYKAAFAVKGKIDDVKYFKFDLGNLK